MYVDVSQDNFMAAVFAAMDLFEQLNGLLDATKITKDKARIVSKTVPFSCQTTIERLSCSARPRFLTASRPQPITADGGGDSYDLESREDRVRIFEFCGVNKDGMPCKLH